MRSAIAYYRVSTTRQGRSGLGLEAQQMAVQLFCMANNYKILREIQEVKSTRKHRPWLQQALELCQMAGATLIVARLDRLGRDVEEIAHNYKLPVNIVVTDNPSANRFTIHILAAVAEEHRRTISINTKEALQTAKLKGVELGKYGKTLAGINKQRANDFANDLKPLLATLKKKGFTIREMVQVLNDTGVPTFVEGSQWHVASVHNVIKRTDLAHTITEPVIA